jgi:metal iron transporter
MPHSLFLGSALATQDRVAFRSKQNASNLANLDKESEESLPIGLAEKRSMFRRFFEDSKEAFLSAFRKQPASVYTTAATRHSERENNSFEFVKVHLYHGTFDMVGSLLGFAVMINSLWLSNFLSILELTQISGQDLDAGFCGLLLWKGQRIWGGLSCQSLRCI